MRMSGESCSRRTFLQVSTLATLGLSQQTNETVAAVKKDTRFPLVILLNAGAQSPYEFVSPLDRSPAELRGPFGSIQTRHGMRVGELWPEFAAVAHRTTIVRSIDGENVEHKAEALFQRSLPQTADRVAQNGVPYPLIYPDSQWPPMAGVEIDKSMRIDWNPEEGRYKAQEMTLHPRLTERRDFLRTLRTVGNDLQIESTDRHRETAFQILQGNTLEKPFQRAAKEEGRYGNDQLGKAAALASQFAQHGAGVTVIYNELQTESGSGWDMHDDLEKRSKELAPSTDYILARLIEDAHRHGFVLLCTTEHGRNPQMNQKGGREHHRNAFMVGAGGRFKEGAVLGAVNSMGEVNTESYEASRVMPTALAACNVERMTNKTIPGTLD